MYDPSFGTTSHTQGHRREAPETLYALIGRDLEAIRALQAQTKASIERCEAVPSIKAERLLNWPTKVGRVVE